MNDGKIKRNTLSKGGDICMIKKDLFIKNTTSNCLLMFGEKCKAVIGQ